MNTHATETQAAKTSTPSFATRAERLALAGLALGVALVLQPWWEGGMRAGFFVTISATIAQILFSHLPERRA